MKYAVVIYDNDCLHFVGDTQVRLFDSLECAVAEIRRYFYRMTMFLDSRNKQDSFINKDFSFSKIFLNDGRIIEIRLTVCESV